MKKLLKFILDSAMLIIYFSVVLVFFEERLALIWSFFRSCFRKGRFRFEDISFILRVEPIGCVMTAVLIILILKVIISFFGMLFGLIGAAGGARQAGTVDNKKWFSAAGSAPGSSSRGIPRSLQARSSQHPFRISKQASPYPWERSCVISPVIR